MIKAIIFDADDTLYATSEAAKKAELSSMKFFARQKKIQHDRLYRDFLEIIEGLKKSNNPMKRHRLHSYGILAKKYKLGDVEKAYEIFFNEVLKEMKLMPDARIALERLYKKYRLVIVSQDFRNQIEKKLHNLGLKKYFRLVITCDDAKVMKPSRKYYRIAFKNLRIKPKEAAVVGDDFEMDLRIPKKMGCRTIIYGFDTEADYCFLDYKKLPRIIGEINKSGESK